MMMRFLFDTVIVCLLLYAGYSYFESTKPRGGPGLSVIRSSAYLRTGDGAPSYYPIVLNPPEEFDGLSKAAILEHRARLVNQYSELFTGDYEPMEEVFGQIVDGAPWWGLEGQYCFGQGPHSSDGLSEESRFVLNPFLLVAVDEAKAFSFPDPLRFRGAYPEPKHLTYQPALAKATVHYAMTEYHAERARRPNWNTPVELTLDLKNAYDFGYRYLMADPEQTKGIQGIAGNAFTYQVRPFHQFIHLGGSCQYQNGCNNGSPYDPTLDFRIEKLPAVMAVKLWKALPKKPSAEADFNFWIYLE